jgi:CubicO group peptidase (beta-lactamase class C family)
MKRKIRCIALITLLLFWLTPALADQSLPKVVPESVGLSSARLERVSEVLKKEVANGEIAGAVGLIMRHGKVAYLESIGMMDVDAGKSMQTDTIFRIASMTKPITSVAIMMLYEEGHFLLEDPLSKFIPEFKNSTVLDRS